MVNGKRKKNGSKKNQNNRLARLPQRRYSSPVGGFPLSRALAASRADPWSFSACVPDGASGVGCFTFKENYTCTTAALGSCGGAIVTTIPGSLKILDTANATAVPIVPANWLIGSANATYATIYGKYRPVSAGIRATYIGNTQTDGGVILAGLVSGGTPASAFNGQTLAQCCVLMLDYKIYPLRQGAKVTWRPSDMDDVADFKGNLVSQATNVALVSPYMLVYVFGAGAAQSLLNLEVCVNFEGQYINQNFMSGGLTSTMNAMAEPGWYEKTMEYLRGVPSVASALGDAINSAGPAIRGSASVLGAMGNGITYYRTINSAFRRPRQLQLEL